MKYLNTFEELKYTKGSKKSKEKLDPLQSTAFALGIKEQREVDVMVRNQRIQNN